MGYLTGVRDRKTKVSFLGTLLVFVLLCTFHSGVHGKVTKITFENGVYQNILIAISEDIDTNTYSCSTLLNAISEVMTRASDDLFSVTSRARFGKIRVLIPLGWTNTQCNNFNIVPASKDDLYEAANIKISSSHPIAKNLPWTEQHQGCGKSGESIFVPPTFLTRSDFTQQARGQVLLHEWMKFRYGVFEEYGFFGDEFYPPCYVRNNGVHYTSCTNPGLNTLEEVRSPNVNCSSVLERHSTSLRDQLSSVSCSLMSAPQLLPSAGSSVSLCSNATHSSTVYSKQNLQCERKSASEVVLNHLDFRTPGSRATTTDSPGLMAEIEVIRPEGEAALGYAFMIEDTDEGRLHNRLKHVKHSVGEFLHFVDENNPLARWAFLLKFGPSFASFAETADSNLTLDLLNQTMKVTFLKDFPDGTFSSSSTASGNSTSDDTGKVTGFEDRFALVRDILRTGINFAKRWHLIYIGSSPLANVQTALDAIKDTDFSVSIVTFDTSKDWLSWYGIRQTRKVLYLPTCDSNNTPCSATASSFLTDHLLEILGDQRPPRFFQKVIDVNLRGDEQKQVSSEAINPASVKNFLVSLPRYSDQASVSLTRPGASGNCVLEPLLEYPGMLSSNASGCPFETGYWSVAMTATGSSNAVHNLRGYTEVTGASSGLSVLPTLGIDMTKEVFPVTQNMVIPLHVAVKNEGSPVLGASVQAYLSLVTASEVTAKTFILLDDGMEPDVTKNDGVYSGNVIGYSSDPTGSFHTGFVKVKTSPLSSTTLVDLDTSLSKAGLLDSRMEEKCCGSVVPGNPRTARHMDETSYSVVLPSFRSGEMISDSFTGAPSRVGIISEIAQRDDIVTVQFRAPSAGLLEMAVDHYDLCSGRNSSLCKPIETAECSPVSPGTKQTCTINKSGLLTALVDPSDNEWENRTNGEVVQMLCGIRGVSTGGDSGPMSYNFVEISLIVGRDAADQPLRECKKISDGCLPIEIFWILIGIVGGLVLILVGLIVYWICVVCRRRKQGKAEPGGKKDAETRVSSGKASRLNGKGKKAGGDFGSQDLFSTAIRRPSTPQEEVEDRSFVNSVRRRSLSSDAPTTRFQSNNDLSANFKTTSSPRESNNRELDEMPVHFGSNNGTTVRRSPQPVVEPFQEFQAPGNTMSYHESQLADDTYFPQRTPRFMSRSNNNNKQNNRHSHGFPSSSAHNSNSTLAVPSVSSMVDMKNSNESINYREPLYASVNRNGRRSGTYIGGGDRNSALSGPPQAVMHHNNNRNSSQLVTPSHVPNSSTAKSLRPKSAQSLDSGFIRGQSPVRSLPPIRMDHFPSSESDTYSEMSRVGGGFSQPPPPPPPMPSSGNPTIPRRSHNNNNNNNSSSSARNSQVPDIAISESASAAVEPRSGARYSRTPPKENGFGILAKMGPIPDRNSVLKPRSGPPPPPPPRGNSVKRQPSDYSNMPSYAHAYNNNINSNNRRIKASNNHPPDSDHEDATGNNNNAEDDNDSDTWDVYDEFEFNTGVSHV